MSFRLQNQQRILRFEGLEQKRPKAADVAVEHVCGDDTEAADVATESTADAADANEAMSMVTSWDDAIIARGASLQSEAGASAEDEEDETDESSDDDEDDDETDE